MFDMAVLRLGRDLIFDLVAPLRCALCGVHGAHVCEHCSEQLARTPLVHRAGSHARLQTFALGWHDGALRAAVLALKYRNRIHAGVALGSLLGHRLPRVAIDALVSVPLHPTRQRMRGCNQADAIARGIACGMDRPVLSDALVRWKPTAPQSGLHYSGRATNVSDAFCAEPRVATMRGLQVAIVDDVITTGATVAACARVLRDRGAHVTCALALALRR